MKPDDPSILDGTYLLRGLLMVGWWTTEGTRTRPTSLAFIDGRTGETSCHVDTVQRRIAYSQERPGKPAARFTAGVARECGFNVASDPGGDPEGSREHVVLSLALEASSRKVYQRACKELALKSEYLAATELVPQ